MRVTERNHVVSRVCPSKNVIQGQMFDLMIDLAKRFWAMPLQHIYVYHTSIDYKV